MQVDFTQAWDTLSQILFKPGGKERIVIIFTNISVVSVFLQMLHR